jgi:transposase, IS5 family
MYRKQGHHSIPPEDFKLPFEGKLSEDNRWVIMAEFVPWSEYEEEYSSSFSVVMGAPLTSFKFKIKN